MAELTLPEDFITQTKAITGDELWQTMKEALAKEPPVSIRMNSGKCTRMAPCEDIVEESVPWCKDAYYLKERPNFTFDPLLHAGIYYVQEASSMFLDTVLRQYAGSEPVKMLDLCAAPGGKSTVARSILPDGSLLVCNEPMRNRANILAENIQKFGNPDVIVTNNFPADFKKARITFDIILTDVPCSGEGMFRKDHNAIEEWSKANVDKCQTLQKEIVESIWECLKPGGLLIYSTCTFNTKENEENIRFITEELGAEVLSVEADKSWNITGSLLPHLNMPVYRFLPGRTKGEGLFMAVLRKKNDGTEAHEHKNKSRRCNENSKNTKSKKATELQWLIGSDDFIVHSHKEKIAAIPRLWNDIYEDICRSLNVIHAGVTIGECKGKDVIPAQSLALSTRLNRKVFATADIDYMQAISFLRKEAITLPPETPRGIVLITYNGFPLGFVKNLGNRANNLYPAEWRIKSTHLPEGHNEILKENKDI